MTAARDLVRLGGDNPHIRAFAQWVAMLRTFLAERRGRASQLARHLRVRRQSVSRWFAGPRVVGPAWAHLAANVWLHRQLTPQARTELLARIRPPGERHLTPRTKTTTRQPQLAL